MDSIGSYRERVMVEYTETDPAPGPHGIRPRLRRMRCAVEVVVDISRAARALGPRACRCPSGRRSRGFLTVRTVGVPVELAAVYQTQEG